MTIACAGTAENAVAPLVAVKERGTRSVFFERSAQTFLCR